MIEHNTLRLIAIGAIFTNTYASKILAGYYELSDTENTMVEEYAKRLAENIAEWEDLKAERDLE